MNVRESMSVAALAAVLLAMPMPPSHAGGVSLEAAKSAYAEGRYDVALVRFERAAHAGDVRAQEIVALMHWHGPALYGEAVREDRGAARYWFNRAAAGGSELGARMGKVTLAGDVDWLAEGVRWNAAGDADVESLATLDEPSPVALFIDP